MAYSLQPFNDLITVNSPRYILQSVLRIPCQIRFIVSWTTMPEIDINLRIVLSNKSPKCQWEEHVSSHVRAILFIVTCTYLPWWKLFFLRNLRNKETICSMVRHIHENEIWVTIDSWEDESLKCLQETDFNLFWSFFPSRRQTTNEVPIATVITTGTLPPS